MLSLLISTTVEKQSISRSPPEAGQLSFPTKETTATANQSTTATATGISNSNNSKKSTSSNNNDNNANNHHLLLETLLGSWLCTRSLACLDSAIANRKQRPLFLKLLRRISSPGEQLSPMQTGHYFDWLVLRCVHVRYLGEVVRMSDCRRLVENKLLDRLESLAVCTCDTLSACLDANLANLRNLALLGESQNAVEGRKVSLSFFL